MGCREEPWLVGFDDGVHHWLVVRTKPRQERIATAHLWQRGVEPYLPLFLEPPWHRRAPKGPVPLFTSYLFVHCTPADQLSAVRFCPGVQGPVVFDQRLAIVDQEVIEALRLREDDRGYILPEEQHLAMMAGQKVRIMAGPLKGLEGVFKGYLKGRQRVQLFMEFLRARNLVEVEASAVAAVRF
jgi:transcription antitermination factor NusG